MKIKSLVVILILVTFLAGCGSRSRSINTVSENPDAKKEVTAANDFQEIYKDWTDRLTVVAEGTNLA